ncbi:MAG: hypothetical protein M1832_003484 [Thelocarpon impressellum]|nr:MAG: hypothetical protein M1832_003484 [Thelocarpon impressellum]
MSPLPNPQLWNAATVGRLQTQDVFANGGWWHDARILAATGEGIDREESRAWDGWWNEQIVTLVQLTMEQRDALNILLTGRSERGFAEIVKRIVASKALEFDVVCLKPEVGPNNQSFANTMDFKQTFLEDLIITYREAEEIRIYEDRPRHVKAFREHLAVFNRNLRDGHYPAPRPPITAEPFQKTLDPVIETAEVQRMINDHNAAVARGVRALGGRQRIKRDIFLTGYMISPEDTQRLLPLANLPENVPDMDLKPMANNILICPRPCARNDLNKIGGIGRKLSWQVTGIGVWENKVWAASVLPVPDTAQHYTENRAPCVVLALRRNAKPADVNNISNWQPVPAERALVFDTVIGEKVLLRVEDEEPRGNGSNRPFQTRDSKRKQPQAHDNDPHWHQGQRAQHPRQADSGRAGYRGSHGGRGARGGGAPQRGGRGNGPTHNSHRGGQGNPRGGSNRGRGRGGQRQFFDDPSYAGGQGHPAQVSYDDHPSGGGNNGPAYGYDGGGNGF